MKKDLLMLLLLTSALASPVLIEVYGHPQLNCPITQSINAALGEVEAEFGDDVKITWIDLDTADGQARAVAVGIGTGHLSDVIMINGESSFRIDGRDISFEGPEGIEWTTNDLKTVITGDAAPPSGQENSANTNQEQFKIPLLPVLLILFGLFGMVFLSRVEIKFKHKKK